MNDPSKLMNQNQMMNPMMMSHPQQQHIINQNQSHNHNQNPQILLNRPNYGMWPLPQNPNFPPYVSSSKRNNWKGKNPKKDKRRIENPSIGNPSSTANYKPPTLKELQHQNRLKARRYFPKKKFNNRSAPFAPRNTTSFIIRAKKSGGIASLVSPCPTPAILPTPKFSPSREALVDTAKEEWGVDGYGSMKGLIRLRSPGNEDDEDSGSSESDVEEHLEVERRLDHDLSRFEMIYPNYGVEYNNILENRVDDQDTHIAQVEEENLILKERLFLMEREMADLRRRLVCLERRSEGGEEVNEEVVENESDNESESHSHGYSRSLEENNDEVYPNVEVKNANEVELKMVNEVETVDITGGDVSMEENNEGEGKQENNCEEVVKNENEVEATNTLVFTKEIKEGDCSLEAKEKNNGVDMESKIEDLVETLTGGDVCMEESNEGEVKQENDCEEVEVKNGIKVEMPNSKVCMEEKKEVDCSLEAKEKIEDFEEKTGNEVET